MPVAARILIADPDKTACLSIEDCLIQEGFDCQCAADAESVLTRLRDVPFDLLIADTSLPNNVNLDLVRLAQKISPGLPAIVVAQSPSYETAIAAVELPVVAYLIKPLNLSVLLEHVRLAVARRRIYRILSDSQQNLNDWSNYTADLTFLTESQKFSPGDSVIKAYIATSLMSIVRAAADISRLLEAMPMERDSGELPANLRSPRTVSLEAALAEAVRVLEGTKQSFKSREIADLRKKLTSVLKSGDSDNISGRI